MASFQHLRPAGDLSPAQQPGRSSLRQTIALGLLAAVCGFLAMAGVRAVQPGGVAPRPLAAALGARQPDASLTRRPAKDIHVRIGRREVSVTRSGGEEFVILMPECVMDEASDVAERIRLQLQNMAFPSVGTVTASFGVTELTIGETAESLLRRTDQAMYRAKSTGRNRVVDAYTGL